MTKKALITGINGQDGSYLAELLLAKGYAVHGLVRREIMEGQGMGLANIAHLLDDITLHQGSASNQLVVSRLIQDVMPDECYHLAASSFVSYDLAAETAILDNNFNSTHYLLATIKESKPDCRFYFAGSSEMFGQAASAPQDEQTAFNPRSIYGISKMAGAILSRNYRSRHGIFACNGYLYNHESTRRPFEFVTRKISSTVAKIHCGLTDTLALGNLEARRDWGYAPEYVDAMWRMLNQSTPADYVIATGRLHSVRDLVACAFSSVNLDYQNYVKVNENFYRQEEAVPLQGNASKAHNELKWQPEKNILTVMEEMVYHDIKRIKQ